MKRPEYMLSDNGCTLNPNPNPNPDALGKTPKTKLTELIDIMAKFLNSTPEPTSEIVRSGLQRVLCLGLMPMDICVYG